MLLARAVLTKYHHAHIGGGYQPYAVHDFLKGGTFTGEYRHTALSCLTFFQYGTDQGDKFILHKLFGNIVYRAEFHAFHGGINFGVVGHNDEGLHLSLLSHPAQKVYATAVRQTQVGNHDIPINLSDISRVEILQGSAARVLGPNAFSGAINIITDSYDSKKLNAELTGGSYNTFGQSLSGNFGDKQFHTFASVSRKSSTGYIANTDFDLGNAFIQSVLNTPNAGKFSLQLSGQLKDFGANSFYTLSYPNQYESSKTFMTALNWSLKKGKWSWNAQAYWRRHHDRFELIRDSIRIKPSWYKSHNYHMTDITGGKASVTYNSFLGNTTLGIEARNEHIFSNVLGTAIDSMRAPLEKNGYFTKASNRLIETAMLDHSVKINKWYFSGGLAVTNSTSFGYNTFGGIDIAYEIHPNIRLFADANSAVRLPTFNDLYYKSTTQLANPELQQERAQTVEAGTKVLFNNWKLDASVYYRMGQNVIDWVKLPTETVWQSKNLTDVNALGTDITSTYYLNDNYIKKITVAYSWLQLDKTAATYDSKYALDYLKKKLTISIDHHIWKNLSASWKAGYYERAGEYTDVNKALKPYSPYFTLDTRLVWADKKFDFFADANNMLNAQYADYGGLTQPGRNFTLGCRLHL
jgi:iron complex outermembrane receptor protein